MTAARGVGGGCAWDAVLTSVTDGELRVVTTTGIPLSDLVRSNVAGDR